MDPALVALLAAAGKSANSLPADMSAALVGGKVSRIKAPAAATTPEQIWWKQSRCTPPVIAATLINIV